MRLSSTTPDDVLLFVPSLIYSLLLQYIIKGISKRTNCFTVFIYLNFIIPHGYSNF